VNAIYNKIVKFTGIFDKIRDLLPRHCLEKLYYAFVHPHVSYGIEVYGTAASSVLDKLHILNSKILRILQGKRIRDIHVIYLYINYKTLPVKMLY